MNPLYRPALAMGQSQASQGQRRERAVGCYKLWPSMAVRCTPLAFLSQTRSWKGRKTRVIWVRSLNLQAWESLNLCQFSTPSPSCRIWEMEELMEHPDVHVVKTHMCVHGMKQKYNEAMTAVLKPTTFITNSPHIAQQLQGRCNRQHAHVPLFGKRAMMAAEYPRLLCEHICRGVDSQLAADGLGIHAMQELKEADLEEYLDDIAEELTLKVKRSQKERTVQEREGKKEEANKIKQFIKGP